MTILHRDKYRTSLFDYALPVVAGLAIFQGLSGGGLLPIIIGVMAAFWAFYTRHSSYDLFPNALVIRYAFPRTTVVVLADVHNVIETRGAYGGAALLLQRTGAKSIVIKPVDRGTFVDQLNGVIRTKDAHA